jgi:hypothetical protein
MWRKNTLCREKNIFFRKKKFIFDLIIFYDLEDEIDENELIKIKGIYFLIVIN